MKKEDFENYKTGRYFLEINWYDKKSKTNKQWYSFFQWGLIIFAAITPVLIVIDKSENSIIQWIPIFSSVIVALFASALKVFKFQEKWVNYRTICETLKKEIHYYSADLYDYQNCKDKDSRFVQRVENLISRENNLWINLANDNKKDGKQKA